MVDNGSADEEVAILREHRRKRHFTLVEVGENRYFSEGNNIGVDHASTDYVVFLNNDAFVHPGWIETLAATMEDDPSIAAVGPYRLLHPDGRVQEVGGVSSRHGRRRTDRGRAQCGEPITSTHLAPLTSALLPASW